MNELSKRSKGKQKEVQKAVQKTVQEAVEDELFSILTRYITTATENFPTTPYFTLTTPSSLLLFIMHV
ncbi:hypothetical protein E2C01_073369 [Portunus trituberculatus]|uniref:Uncharacterized protein n=1 Tax=Portunus trituberculatus TaxID=210409 RepID=A0A5B7IBH7_PORTR|nr:hypothetical protein [Portunus trituberculatus]